MLTNILVPLDGSTLASCVFPHLIILSNTTRAQVTLLHVLERTSELPGRSNPLDWQFQRAEAQAYLDETGAYLGEFLDQEPECILIDGRPAEQIIDFAQRQATDLVVLSSHGKGGLNGWNLSSVAQKIVSRIGKSLLIVPAYSARSNEGEGNPSLLRYRRILVLLDGSLRAESVLPLASSLAQSQDAQLLLAHVVARPEMMQRTPLNPDESTLCDQIVERNNQQATKYMEYLRTRVTPEPETRVLINGSVAASLQRMIEHEAIDLVLFCAHGASGNTMSAYGSVASSVLNSASVPLLIVQDMPTQDLSATQAARAANVVTTPLMRTGGVSSGGASGHSAGEISAAGWSSFAGLIRR